MCIWIRGLEIISTDFSHASLGTEEDEYNFFSIMRTIISAIKYANEKKNHTHTQTITIGIMIISDF